MFQKLTPGDDADGVSCPSLQSCREEYCSRMGFKHFLFLQKKKNL